MLRMTSLTEISEVTHAFRAGHTLGGWVYTQAWLFDGGDAIVAMVGQETLGVVFLRIGHVVRTYRAQGILDAMRQAGISPLPQVSQH